MRGPRVGDAEIGGCGGPEGGEVGSVGEAGRLIAEFDGVWDQVRGRLNLVLNLPGVRGRLMGFLDRVNAGVGHNDEALARVGRHIIGRVLELRKK